MAIAVELIKKLREETQAGVADCRQALEDAQGDIKKAKELIMERGLEKASKKSDRETGAGLVESYVHAGRVGALVEIFAETDFVVRNEEFKKLAHEVAMQVAAMNPKDAKELLESPYIRDAKLTINDLVKSVIAKVGENITIGRISRIGIGEK